MKNKESRMNTVRSTASKKSKIDPKEAAKLITSGKAHSSTVSKTRQKGPSKTQVERLKKFYNTTRWLPNSAFTTYFGKPAFENYGYGNTKPVYGGLFYGNYMLSHNLNPMDGPNIPDTKQVYSSAMLKAISRGETRKPSPPRKVPDEIRNTPEELDDIKGRNPIFQLPNHFPSREMVKPNLVKARYFRSGRNTPEDSMRQDGEYEVFEIDDFLRGKAMKTKKLKESSPQGEFNPFQQGKVKLEKKKNKEDLNMVLKEASKKLNAESIKINRQEDDYEEENGQRVNGNENELEQGNDTYRKKPEQSEKYDARSQHANGRKTSVYKEELEKEEYLKKSQFYEKMLADSTDVNMNVGKRDSVKIRENILQGCAMCDSTDFAGSTMPLKKKENPALVEPTCLKHTYVCCVHQTNNTPVEAKDPRNYKDKPPCLLNTIDAAGKPMKRSEPLGNLFK